MSLGSPCVPLRARSGHHALAGGQDMVEAGGVEPPSEKPRGQETTGLSHSGFSPQPVRNGQNPEAASLIEFARRAPGGDP